MRLDPKEKWERRKENWKSRAHVHEGREEKLKEFAQQEMAVSVPVESVVSEPVVSVAPTVTVAAPSPEVSKQSGKKDGDIGIGIVVNGSFMFMEFHWRNMAGNLMPSKLNQRDMREMFKKALSTIGRIE